MFNSREKSSPTATTNVLSSVNSIGQGTVVEGSISANTDIRIDGEINGNLKCNGKLILGESGKIIGEIECINALIEGKIKGKIVVKELLQVRDTATVDGEISTDKLDVDSGAVFNVSCTMGGKTTAIKSGADKTSTNRK